MNTTNSDEGGSTTSLFMKPIDIQKLTGLSITKCQRLIKTIRNELGLKRRRVITIKEFCSFTGYELAEVRQVVVSSRFCPPNYN